MKNNFLKLSIIIFSFLLIVSCTDKEDSTVDKALDGVTNGAILRTIKEDQKTFNFFDTNSKWILTVEEQDQTSGENFKEVKIYVKHTKGLVTTPEKLIKVVPASAFAKIAPRNLPQAKLEVSLAEALTTLNIAAGGYTPADKFTIRLELVLNDGRIYTNTNTSTPLTNGYFNSPFVYSVQFFCPLASAADFNGNYKVTADAWEDYSIGDTVPVSYIPADGTYKFRILCSANNFISNGATTYLLVTIDPLTAAVTAAANQPFLYLPAIPPTTVTGTGSVGSCTGDINLKLKFVGGYNAANQTFNLVKI